MYTALKFVNCEKFVKFDMDTYLLNVYTSLMFIFCTFYCKSLDLHFI